MDDLQILLNEDVERRDKAINVYSKKFYDGIKEHMDKYEVNINTKYKTVARKIKPVALPLPSNFEERIKKTSIQPNLRDLRKIGHKFNDDLTLDGLKIRCNKFLRRDEERCFKEMLSWHGKAFLFESYEIGCIDPSIVASMVIFIIPHKAWNLMPILVSKVHLPKLVELLNRKIKMEILEPSIAPYFNRWFMVPKKKWALRFIQDMKLVNKITVRNMASSPIIDEFI